MNRAKSGSQPMREAVNKEPVTLESVLAKENLNAAWSQVKANDGAAGVDGRDIEDSRAHILKHWTGIEAALRSGRYKPEAVLAVEMPKPSGGLRTIGIPTVCSNCTRDQRVFGLGRYHPSVPPAAKPEIPYLEVEDVLGPADVDFGGRGMRYVFGFAGMD
jgi:hypothetical protein